MEQNKKKWLSHSGIDILYRCPRCFWLKYNKNIYQPEGIVSRLPDRFDRVIKKYFDKFRKTGGLPPIVKDKIEGKIDNDKKYIPADFKTASSDPVGKAIYPAYQNQLDEYALLLEANNKKTAGSGYIIIFLLSQKLSQGFFGSPKPLISLEFSLTPQMARR